MMYLPPPLPRLCPQCEATLQSRLAEQDRSLAPAVLQWRLETSREASRRLPAAAPAAAPHLHLLLALVTLVIQWPGLALWLQHTKLPAWLELQLEAALFPHLSPAEAAAQLLPSLAPALGRWSSKAQPSAEQKQLLFESRDPAVTATNC